MKTIEEKSLLVPIKHWLGEEEDEQFHKTMNQVRNVAKLPWVFHHVALMADGHPGKGSTIGSVIAMKNAISPATIGVDLGCGMGTYMTTLTANDLPTNLKDTRHQVERDIPVGFNEHKDLVTKKGTNLHYETEKLFAEFEMLTPEVQDLIGKASRQLGTLGGGK